MEPYASKLEPCRHRSTCGKCRTIHMAPLNMATWSLLQSRWGRQGTIDGGCSPSRVIMKDSLRKIFWPTVVLCLGLNLLGSAALAQEKQLDRPLVASGTSPMLEQDSADARKLALEEALRAAVEQSLGWLLPAQRIVRYYPLLLNRILNEPMSYVQDYQIIHEGVILGRYRVTVQTTLYNEGLMRDLRRLGLFLAFSERPRVTILVAERTSPEEQWRWWWQMESFSFK